MRPAVSDSAGGTQMSVVLLPATSLQYYGLHHISNRRTVATKTMLVHSIIRTVQERQPATLVSSAVSQRSFPLPQQALRDHRGRAGLPAPLLPVLRLCSYLPAWVHQITKSLCSI